MTTMSTQAETAAKVCSPSKIIGKSTVTISQSRRKGWTCHTNPIERPFFKRLVTRRHYDICTLSSDAHSKTATQNTHLERTSSYAVKLLPAVEEFTGLQDIYDRNLPPVQASRMDCPFPVAL